VIPGILLSYHVF